jgi:hypothetical protein
MKAMHIMACIFLLVYAVFLIADWENYWMELLALLPTSIAVLYFVIFKGNNLKQVQVNQVLRLFEIGFLGMASSYFYKVGQILPMILFGVLALFLLVLLIIENKIFSDRFIELNEHEIIWPQLFHKRKIPWQNINSLILKFHVLTFDLKDKEFIQQDVYHKYDESELALFEDFLKRQLS